MANNRKTPPALEPEVADTATIQEPELGQTEADNYSRLHAQIDAESANMEAPEKVPDGSEGMSNADSVA